MSNNPNNLPIEILTNNNYLPKKWFARAPDSNLVYAPMLKCASTYYRNMCEINGWTSIEYSQIDWDKDQVFGFIMDPYRRHVKGLVEDHARLKKVFGLTLDQVHDKFWHFAPTIGIHSIGITQFYYGLYDKMTWIPLNIPGVDTKQQLQILFDQNRVNWRWDHNVNPNIGDQNKQKVFEDLWTKFDGPGFLAEKSAA